MTDPETTTSYRCGVECEDGTPCSREVSGPERTCWQHVDYEGLSE